VIAARVAHLLERLETETDKTLAASIRWMLERTKSYEGQFTDPAAPRLTIGMQNNVATDGVFLGGNELDAMRARLDAVKQRQEERRRNRLLELGQTDGSVSNGSSNGAD
jgi:hypothetical protein